MGQIYWRLRSCNNAQIKTEKFWGSSLTGNETLTIIEQSLRVSHKFVRIQTYVTAEKKARDIAPNDTIFSSTLIIVSLLPARTDILPPLLGASVRV